MPSLWQICVVMQTNRHPSLAGHCQTTDTAQNRLLCKPPPLKGALRPKLHTRYAKNLSHDKATQGQVSTNFKWRVLGFGFRRESWEPVGIKFSEKALCCKRLEEYILWCNILKSPWGGQDPISRQRENGHSTHDSLQRFYLLLLRQQHLNSDGSTCSGTFTEKMRPWKHTNTVLYAFLTINQWIKEPTVTDVSVIIQR